MKTYTFDDFTINPNNETIITYSQVWISLFNTSVADLFRQIALEEINKYIATHEKVLFDKSDDLTGVLQADMIKNVDIDEKYSILIFIYNENKGLEKELMIKIPILAKEDYFKEFKRLVLEELEKLIFT